MNNKIRINNDGYLERKPLYRCENPLYKDWWLIKAKGQAGVLYVSGKTIYLPKEYIGKRIRIKLEII